MREMKKGVLGYLSSHTRSKITLKDLARAVKVSGKEQFTTLRQLIEQMKREGIVAADERGRLTYVTERKRAKEPTTRNVIATVTITRRGMGIVRPEGWTEEIQIGPRSLRTALPGDVVEVIPFARPRKHKPGEPIEGEVVRVVSRTITRITGRMDVRRDFAFVVPDDRRMPRDIFLSPAEARKAKPGDKVVVELLPWEDAGMNPEGMVVEVLGPSGDARVEVLSVARSFGLPAGFPYAVEAEAASLPGSISAAEIAARMDLRAVTTFTIDPEDARDFDDALSCEVMPDGRYRLGVHIADVSHYVREGTELDREAYARGTSVYLVNEVIPMLPEKLSNDLCSLRPREDRLTYSVLMEITPDGKVDDVRFARTVIHSKRRFSYEEAQQILTTGAGEYNEELGRLHALARNLYKRRRKNGSLDFDTSEVKFAFDRQGLPDRIIKKVRLDAHRLVEECMLLANKCVAQHVGKMKTGGDPHPFLYRVHDLPDPGKLRDLGSFVKQFGFALDVKEGVSSRQLQKLLDSVKGTDVEEVITEVALRSMAKAVYAEKNIGHYGLAFRDYTHFTSPIRRYPDLVVHRLLDEYGRAPAPARIVQMRARMPGIARQSSDRERLAVEAERASVKVMQIEYMKRHIGDEFEGVIAGVTDFGLFVELPDLLIQGLIRVRDLADDYYLFDQKQYALRGRSRGQVYRLGDHVRVRVLAVDPETRELDLELLADRGRNF
jgi:ribonuclease R